MADDNVELPWEVTFEDAPNGKFTKRNPAKYRALIARLAQTINESNGKSQIATVTVVTGDPISVDKKSRGSNERVEETYFRAAAQEKGLGLRVDPTHRSDGNTDLRIQIQPKKEFSAEAIASRKQKLADGRAKKAALKEQVAAAARVEAAAIAKAQAQAPAPKPKAQS